MLRPGAGTNSFILAALLLCLPLGALASQTPLQQSDNSFAVRNVRVFDGRNVIGRANVIIENGLIKAVGPDAPIPKGLTVYDGAGKTLLPGLIDAHVHTYGRSRENALRFGVTTELDMFTDWRLIAQAKIQRQSLKRVDRADMWSAGTLATVPGGHGTEFSLKIPTLTSPDQAQVWVDARIAEGSDYIKIILDDGSAYKNLRQAALVLGANLFPARPKPTLGPATVKALIDAAHKRGKMAVIHIAAAHDAKLAVEDGVEGLAHVFVDKLATQDLINLIKQHGTFVISTLSVYSTMACGHEAENLLHDEHLATYLSRRQKLLLLHFFGGCFPSALKNAKANIGRLDAANVPILAGTDAGEPGVAHGASLHGELKLLVESGLTPVEALAAATSVPAHYFHLDDRGWIAPGLRADLLLVDGDPTTDIAATRDIAVIWKNGYPVSRFPPSDGSPFVAMNPLTDLISNFDHGEIASQYGYGWHGGNDQPYGGSSSAELHLADSGANDTTGALEISGIIRSGVVFPWAGAVFSPAKNPDDERNFSGKHGIVFWTRGDGQTYSVMLFSGSTRAGQPVMFHFTAGHDWHRVCIPFSAFDGVDVQHLRGIAFAAGPQTGPFRFEIDSVRTSKKCRPQK